MGYVDRAPIRIRGEASAAERSRHSLVHSEHRLVHGERQRTFNSQSFAYVIVDSFVCVLDVCVVQVVPLKTHLGHRRQYLVTHDS